MRRENFLVVINRAAPEIASTGLPMNGVKQNFGKGESLLLHYMGRKIVSWNVPRGFTPSFFVAREWFCGKFRFWLIRLVGLFCPEYFNGDAKKCNNNPFFDPTDPIDLTSKGRSYLRRTWVLYNNQWVAQIGLVSLLDWLIPVPQRVPWESAIQALSWSDVL